MWILRHALAIVILPVTVTILVPGWICRRYGVVLQPPTESADWVAIIAGAFLLLAGLVLFVAAVSLFSRFGKGTLAPWDPPAHLVVRGPYRFVRNPMISGVLLIVAGESLVMRSTELMLWTGAFFLLNAIFIPLFEEPQLARRFGEEYRRYRQNVPRLLPRMHPWKGEKTSS
jgi:protein-S-isoprenylcysteine O-methyltransferase Ste14